MKNFLVFALASACIANPATAATGGITYLTCTVSDITWQVALNENAGTVSYVHRNGVVYEKAVFTADSVVWETRLGRFTISRVDLSLTHKMDDYVKRDTCTIAKAPSRAF